MAAAGGGEDPDTGRDDPDHNPFFAGQRHVPQRHLSRDDIGNQARMLLTHFIHDRLAVDGFGGAPGELIEPGTPMGPPVERMSQVARSLRQIGDQLDQDNSLQRLIHQISPDAPQKTFLKVAAEIFSDGIFNWGRVVALFYFAYKMIVKAMMQKLNQIPFLRGIVEWVVEYIVNNVAQWIISRGGWGAIEEYFGASNIQFILTFLGGVSVSAFYIAWKAWRR